VITSYEQYSLIKALYLDVECGDPPVRPGAGTWEWNGNYSHGTQIQVINLVLKVIRSKAML
jgi:hypothetical protein